MSATAKPWASCDKRIHGRQPPSSCLDDAGADVDAERLGEAEIGGERQHQTDGRIAQRLPAAEAVRHQNEQHRRGGGEAERLDQRDVGDQARRDEADRTPVDRHLLLVLRLPAAAQALRRGAARRAAPGRRRSDRGRPSGRPWSTSARPASARSAQNTSSATDQEADGDRKPPAGAKLRGARLGVAARQRTVIAGLRMARRGRPGDRQARPSSLRMASMRAVSSSRNLAYSSPVSRIGVQLRFLHLFCPGRAVRPSSPSA